MEPVVRFLIKAQFDHVLQDREAILVYSGGSFCHSLVLLELNRRGIVMAINLKKYESELREAYNDVLSDKTDTNW